MAEKLIFPIGFDLEAARREAEDKMGDMLQRMNDILRKNPLKIHMAADDKGFKTYAAAFSTSNKEISAAMDALRKKWNEMPNADKFMPNSTKFSAEAQEIIRQFTQLTEASKRYGMALDEVTRQAIKSIDDEVKAQEKALAATQRRHQQDIDLARKREEVESRVTAKIQQAQAAVNDRQNLTIVEQKTNAYNRQSEVVSRLQAKLEQIKRIESSGSARLTLDDGTNSELKNRLIQRSIELTKELGKETVKLSKMPNINQSLRAQENIMDNLTAKLRIYQQQIQGQVVGSDAWNKTALEIRRVAEELQRANQRMADFQQKAFQGLGNTQTEAEVHKLTQLRNELRMTEESFNRLRQLGGAYDSNGGLTPMANDLLKERQRITKEINQMLATAADAQLQREKEINAVIKQRQAEESRAKAVRQAELAALKQKRAENDNIRKILAAEENTIKSITAKLQVQQQRLQSTSMDSAKFTRIAKEVERLTKALEDAEKKMNVLSGKTVSPKGIKETTRELREQSTYIERLIQRMTVYASLGAMTAFVNKVREVTAEFELQRISLGAIIQDQAKANQLFSEIKQFALKSPLKILDLTRYTKQLAAYRIGVDDLFDTTKRLADISVGLGVDMQRLILFYGQVRATGYLRASEVRQATEAGIPLVESLAAKLSQVNGKLVTSAEVMDMISKRAISFEMVKDVFEDLTSKGGMFYEMQEKQGNTLFGMWAKLGDAASMMYDEIGNTEWVNSGMKSLIETLRYLMIHWKQTGTVIAGVTTLILVNVIAQKNAALATKVQSAANQEYIATMNAKRVALTAELQGEKSIGVFKRINIVLTRAQIKAQMQAAAATNVFSKSLYKLKAALLSNPFTALAVALTTVLALLWESEDEMEKLANKLDEIEGRYAQQSQEMKSNFVDLVTAATNSVDGSKKQKEALDELNRTYGQILGSETLEINNLRAMKDEYGELIDLIDEYNIKRKGEEQAEAIKSIYGESIGEAQKDLREFFEDSKLSVLNQTLVDSGSITLASFKAFTEEVRNLTDAEISKIMLKTQELASQGITDAERYSEALKELGVNSEFALIPVLNYAQIIIEQNKALDENSESIKSQIARLNEYSSAVENLNETIQTIDWAEYYDLYNRWFQTESGSDAEKNIEKQMERMIGITPVGIYQFDPKEAESEFDKMLQVGNAQISIMMRTIREIASKEGVENIDQFYQEAAAAVDDHTRSFSIIDFDGLIAQFQSPKAKAALKEIRTFYENVQIPNRTANTLKMRLAEIASNTKVSLDDMTMYYMKADEDIRAYAKRIKDAIEDLSKKIAEMKTINAINASRGLNLVYSDEEIAETEKQLEVLQGFFKLIDEFDDSSKSKGAKSDTRLQEAQEAVSIYEKLYSRYKELIKTMSSAEAMSYISKNYKQNLDYLEKYGVAFDGTVKGQIAGLKKLRERIKSLPKSEKAVAEVDLKIGDTSLNEFTENVKKALDKAAADIAKSKESKELFDTIFNQTADYDLAMNLTVSVYGENGIDMQEDIVEQLRMALQGGVDENGNTWGISLPMGAIIDPETFEINYKALRHLIRKKYYTIPEEQRKLLEDILKNGEKFSADQSKQWAKDLAKAKTYVEEYVSAYQKIATEQANIQTWVNQGRMSKEQGEKMIAMYDEKWAKDSQKLQYEAFKNTPLYTAMFDKLENASVGALTAMQTKLQEMKSSWKNLAPTQIKELQSRLNEIDEQLAEKDPFKVISESWKTMNELMVKYGTRDALDAMITSQGAAVDSLQKQLEDALARQKAAPKGSSEYEQATTDVESLSQQLESAQETQNELVSDATKWGNALKNLKKGISTVTKLGRKLLDVSEAAADFVESLGGAEDAIELFRDINEVVSKTFDLADALTGAIDLMSKTTAEGVKDVERASVILAVISAALQIATALFNLFSNAKVRKAEKEIEKQQKIIDQLEYQYSRLEEQMEKTFGTEYISNYNRRMEMLQAQAVAYQKQLAAERSKGKKADDDKIKDYEESIRDIQDQIADMKSDVSAKMLGTDLTSAARDFANAWLDAYKEFGSTTDSMKEKFSEMMQNMVVESLLGRVMQQALKPVFDMIDNMEGSDFYDKNYWAKVQKQMNTATDYMEVGANNVMNMIESAGISMRSTADGLTGISRDIASASEESINGLAAGINTQNFYISQIHANVQGIYALLQGGGQTAVATDTSLLSSQHLAQLPSIAQNTADTVARLDALTTLMRKVISPRTSQSVMVVNVN